MLRRASCRRGQAGRQAWPPPPGNHAACKPWCGSATATVVAGIAHSAAHFPCCCSAANECMTEAAPQSHHHGCEARLLLGQARRFVRGVAQRHCACRGGRMMWGAVGCSCCSLLPRSLAAICVPYTTRRSTRNKVRSNWPAGMPATVATALPHPTDAQQPPGRLPPGEPCTHRHTPPSQPPPAATRGCPAQR